MATGGLPGRKSLIIVLLVAAAVGLASNSGLAEKARTAAPALPTGNVPASPSSNDAQLDKLRDEFAELKRKVDKPPKDTWDKITAISGFASAIAVALIGFYATNLYNRRQKQSEERRKDQEVLLAQIQTVEKFIPHLSSQDEQIKAAALIAIAAMGNDELAVKLATAFKGLGAISALTAIASGGSAEAERALLDILKYLEPRVVAVRVCGVHRAGGFIAAPNGAVVTRP
jgi:hypothetical protein